MGCIVREMLVRAVVTDVDGTIALGDGSVTPSTLRASRELADSGIPLVAATARTPAGLALLKPEVPAFALAVCCNGSIGLDMRSGQSLWRQGLLPATTARIVSVLAARLPDAGIAAYDGSGWALTENYLAVRGTRPRGPSRVAGTEAFGDGDVFALSVCHPRLPAGACDGRVARTARPRAARQAVPASSRPRSGLWSKTDASPLQSRSDVPVLPCKRWG